jgi:hypothetical protein
MDYYALPAITSAIGILMLSAEKYNMSSPTEMILADPDFTESLLDTIAQIKSGEVEWHKYDEVLEAYKGR